MEEGRRAPASAGANAEAWKLFYDFLDAVACVQAESLQSEPSRELERLLDLSQRIGHGFARYLDHDAATLDDAFAVRRPKGYQLAKERARRAKQQPIYRDFLLLYHAGAPVDPSTWEVLAAMHNVPQHKVREYIYDARRRQGLNRWPPRRQRKPLPERMTPYLRGQVWWTRDFREGVGKSGNTDRE